MKVFKGSKVYEAKHAVMSDSTHKITVMDPQTGEEAHKFLGGNLDAVYTQFRNAGYKPEGAVDRYVEIGSGLGS